jgi:hypothetical protein
VPSPDVGDAFAGVARRGGREGRWASLGGEEEAWRGGCGMCACLDGDGEASGICMWGLWSGMGRMADLGVAEGEGVDCFCFFYVWGVEGSRYCICRYGSVMSGTECAQGVCFALLERCGAGAAASLFGGCRGFRF